MAMTSRRFVSFVRYLLVPKLKEGDIVVMDNLRAHHNPEIKELAKRHGFAVLYTPPYSPQYNPIELVWAIMKQRLRFRLCRLAKNFRYAIAGAWRGLRRVKFKKLFDACGIAGPTHAI